MSVSPAPPTPKVSQILATPGNRSGTRAANASLGQISFDPSKYMPLRTQKKHQGSSSSYPRNKSSIGGASIDPESLLNRQMDPSLEELEQVPKASITSLPNPRETVRRFLWVPLDKVSDITEDVNISIDAASEIPGFFEHYPMYNMENMKNIRSKLGVGYAHYAPDPQGSEDIPVLHQGVVMMQHLKDSFKRDVGFRTWQWLQSQLRLSTSKGAKSSLRKSDQDEIFRDPRISCVIILSQTMTAKISTAQMFADVMALQELRGFVFRCFPSQAEMIQEDHKLGDIRALDVIAASSPYRYSYRPRTCFDHTRLRGASQQTCTEHCPLKHDARIVLKRNLSCGGQHVQEINNTSELPRHILNQASSFVWIGQEYIPSLKEFGEFRVFIAAKPRRGSLRGRTGYISHTVLTTWLEGNSGEIIVRVPDIKTWISADCQPLTQEDLDEFALYFYERLRALDDWKEKFETLEAGVRLDIGIAVDPISGEKRFFVNEITRFYSADFFSQQTLEPPGHRTCHAFAEAIHNYFPVP